VDYPSDVSVLSSVLLLARLVTIGIKSRFGGSVKFSTKFSSFFFLAEHGVEDLEANQVIGSQVEISQ
jgi:hypothetical protein